MPQDPSPLVQPIGFPGFTPETFTQYLQETDPCFGKSFAKSSKECQACLLPVLMDGRILLLNDLCSQTRKAGGVLTGDRLLPLTSQEVRERLGQGASPEDLFASILGEADPKILGGEARRLLKTRLTYLRQQGTPVPDLPPLSELTAHV